MNIRTDTPVKKHNANKDAVSKIFEGVILNSSGEPSPKSNLPMCLKEDIVKHKCK